ncbi:MAG: hypothetical protein RID07_06630 [Lacipirellulaceae bacterium]
MFSLTTNRLPSIALAAFIVAIGFSWWSQTAFAQFDNPGGGRVVTWTSPDLAASWHQSEHWNLGVPQAGDAVVIDVNAGVILNNQDAERIRSLYIAGGSSVGTTGQKLPVGNSTGDAKITVTGDWSGLYVGDRPGTGPDVDTDYLEVRNDAHVTISGGRLQVDREIDYLGGNLYGYGLVEAGGSGNAMAFLSNSLVLPIGGSQGDRLTLRATGGGRIYFGDTDIEVTHYYSDLFIESELSSPLYGDVIVGGGNRLDFSHPWELEGTLTFGYGQTPITLPGGYITGAEGRIEGELSVDTARRGEIDSDVVLASSGSTTLNPFSTLKLNGAVDAHPNHVMSLSPGSLLQFNGPSSGLFENQREISGRIEADSAILEFNRFDPTGYGHTTHDGYMELGGSQSQVPSTVRSDSFFNKAGQLYVSGAGGRLESEVNLRPTSTTLIDPATELLVAAPLKVLEHAQVGGGGRIRVEPQGELLAHASASMDIVIINEGNVKVHYSYAAAPSTFWQDYYQAGSGTMQVFLLEEEDYDHLKTDLTGHLHVVGDAHLDGVLEGLPINEETFDPVLGDEFLIMTSNTGIHGEFDNMELQSLSTGLCWDLSYEPLAVTLSVVADLANADVDDSGLVDGFDFLTIQRGIGQPRTLSGDANGDGLVNSQDIKQWGEEYGKVYSSTAAFTNVPEPSAAILLAVFLVGGLCWRGRAFWRAHGYEVLSAETMCVDRLVDDSIC